MKIVRGVHWLIKPADLKEKKELTKKFAYLTKDEIASSLRKELGQGFHTIQTKHYVICSSAASPYTQWCGELFEHLEETFLDYWKNKGLELTPPKKTIGCDCLQNQTGVRELRP